MHDDAGAANINIVQVQEFQWSAAHTMLEVLLSDSGLSALGDMI